MFSKKNYYSKMMLIFITVTVAITTMANIIIIRLSKKYDEEHFLYKYNTTLSLFENTFQEIISKNFNLTGYMIKDTANYSMLCQFLEYDISDIRHNSYRILLYNYLNRLSHVDKDINGFILYSYDNKWAYYCNINDHVLKEIPVETAISSFMPFSQNLVPQTQIEQLTNNSSFAIASTLFQSAREIKGYLITLYSTEAFSNLIKTHALDENALFTICNSGNECIYSSGNASINTKKQFHSSVRLNRYNVDISYSVPADAIPINILSYGFPFVTIILCAVSLLLYYITFNTAKKKVKHIQYGLKMIGEKNLNYRISIENSSDEYTQIMADINSMCDRLQTYIERAYLYELQQKKSELYALQSSINPHFLYNSLEIIRSRVMAGNANDASQMLILLSKIYRNQNSRKFIVTLEEELELAESFMVLYQYRFDNFEYEFDIEHSLSNYIIPKNTLQPLIENYFVHGINTEKDDNYIIIKGEKHMMHNEAYIHLTVMDNGVSISDERVEEINKKLSSSIYDILEAKGFALTNVYSRLRIIFGDRVTMYTSNNTDMGIGFKTDIYIPMIKKDGLDNTILIESSI